jgi:hypothetical protein
VASAVPISTPNGNIASSFSSSVGSATLGAGAGGASNANPKSARRRHREISSGVGDAEETRDGTGLGLAGESRRLQPALATPSRVIVAPMPQARLRRGVAIHIYATLGNRRRRPDQPATLN